MQLKDPIIVLIGTSGAVGLENIVALVRRYRQASRIEMLHCARLFARLRVSFGPSADTHDILSTSMDRRN